MQELVSKSAFTSFDLEDLYNKFENQYKHNFSSACMPILSLKEIFDGNELEALRLTDSKLDYTQEFGSLELRQALVANLYPELSLNNFISTAGAAEAIYLVMKSLFKEGDKIIVQKPIYQSLFQIAQDAGALVIDWQVENNSWSLDALEELLKQHPDAKALVINNPNNPVGTAFDKAQLERIIKLLDGRLVVSDEVFQPLSSSPSLASLYENAVSICDLSKSFSLPGLRLGWITCQKKEMLDKFSALRNYLSLRTNTLSELIAPEVLNYSDKILSRNKNILDKNINSLFAMNKDDLFFELDIKKDQIAGLTIFPKLKSEYLELSSEDLVKSKSIFLALGESFGKEHQGHCRIGLGNLAKLEMLK